MHVFHHPSYSVNSVNVGLREVRKCRAIRTTRGKEEGDHEFLWLVAKGQLFQKSVPHQWTVVLVSITNKGLDGQVPLPKGIMGFCELQPWCTCMDILINFQIVNFYTHPMELVGFCMSPFARSFLFCYITLFDCVWSFITSHTSTSWNKLGWKQPTKLIN